MQDVTLLYSSTPNSWHIVTVLVGLFQLSSRQLRNKPTEEASKEREEFPPGHTLCASICSDATTKCYINFLQLQS